MELCRGGRHALRQRPAHRHRRQPRPGGARRPIIYLIGGGACWDEASCYRQGRAAFIEEGFTGADFRRWPEPVLVLQPPGARERLRRSPPVFVPYCTGDIHAGDRVAQYGGRATHHVGARNIDALTARIAATWPDLERVVLVGGSAGGYGALLTWHRVRAAFPGVRVAMVDDAGAPIPSPEFALARRRLWTAAWGFADTLPADCPACVDDWARLVPYNLERAPGARAALLTAVADGVIADYMQIDGATFERGLARALAETADPRFGAFLVAGSDHVLMAGPYVAGGQTVPAWLAAMQADDPAWGSVGPSPLPPCGELAACDACALCAVEGPCQAEYRACEAIGGCVEATVCALGCRPDDVACIAACAAPFPGVGEAALALYTCTRCGQCGGACGACP
ncbi:MAG: pectin acetylesterase-family hydrolase [bacterium]